MDVDIIDINRVIELADEIQSPAFGINNVSFSMEGNGNLGFWESNAQDYEAFIEKIKEIDDIINRYEISAKNIASAIRDYAVDLREISNRRFD